jgi:LacI family transcriptional regulator
VGGTGDWTCESGYQAMIQIMQLEAHPTAIFAANDRMAIGAMHALNQAGMRVPDDVSIIGLDDIEVAAYQIPPLTTIRQSFAELGTRALKLLLEIIETGYSRHSPLVMEPQLVERQSTGPAVG